MCAFLKEPRSHRIARSPSDASLQSGVTITCGYLECSPVSVYNVGDLYSLRAHTCRQLPSGRRKALKTILIAVQRSPITVTLMLPSNLSSQCPVLPVTDGPRVSLESLLLAISTVCGGGVSSRLPRLSPSLARHTWAAYYCCPRPRRPPALPKIRAGQSVCISSHALG